MHLFCNPPQLSFSSMKQSCAKFQPKHLQQSLVYTHYYCHIVITGIIIAPMSPVHSEILVFENMFAPLWHTLSVSRLHKDFV